MNTQATPPTPQSNRINFSDLLAAATQHGAEAAKGKDSQIKLLLRGVEGGYHNAADLTKHKHGTDMDDAAKLAEAYYKGQTGAAVFDPKAPNQAKLASIVRTSVKLGGWPKGGSGEPLATVNELMTIWRNLRKIPAEAKKLDDAANTLLKYARTQLKMDTLIPEADLKDFCYKPTKGLATPEEILEGVVKQLDKLISGAAAQGTAQDNSQEVREMRHKGQQRLAAIAKARAALKGPNPTPLLKAV